MDRSYRYHQTRRVNMGDDDITPAKGITIGTKPVFKEAQNTFDKKKDADEQ